MPFGERVSDIAVNQIKREIAIDDKMCETDLGCSYKDLFKSNTDSERLSQKCIELFGF